MQLKLKLILAILLSTLGQLVYANICEERSFTDAILKQAKLGLDQGLIADCKVLPQQHNRALVIFQQGDPDEAEYSDEGQSYQLHLLTADIQQKKLVDHYTDPVSYTSDALRLESISIDTAAYQLQADLRAVGLRINFHGSSSVNPYRYTLLNLYDLKRHKKLLNNLRVNLSHGENDGRCNAENHSRTSSVVLHNTQHHGLFDLRINTKEENEVFQFSKKDNNCVRVKRSENKRSHQLQYNGKNYVLPQYLQEDGL